MNTGIINEEWRSISGYVNYQVSNIGRVRNATTGLVLKEQISNVGYRNVGICLDKKQKRFLTHRLVAGEFIDNPDNKKCVDHINHDKGNNTINNLRWVSTSENSANRTKRTNTSSKYKGVCIYKRDSTWQALIKINGKQKSLGRFSSEKEAATKYNQAAIEHFGQYALLNEISSDESDNETEDVDDDEATID